MNGGTEALVSTGDSVKLIDLDTGNRIDIATQSIGTGESLQNLTNIEYDPFRQTIYTWGSNHEGLYAMSLITGDRVLVSK